jgi:hypothetical protein
MWRPPRLHSLVALHLMLADSPLPSVVYREPTTLPRPRSSVPYSLRSSCSSLLSCDGQADDGQPLAATPTRPPLISLLVVNYTVAAAAPYHESTASAQICGERSMRRSLPPSTFAPDL